MTDKTPHHTPLMAIRMPLGMRYALTIAAQRYYEQQGSQRLRSRLILQAAEQAGRDILGTKEYDRLLQEYENSHKAPNKKSLKRITSRRRAP